MRRSFLVFLGGCVLLSVTVLFAHETTQWAPALGAAFFALALIWLCWMAVLPFHAGFRGVLPNRVVTLGGTTWITPKPFPVEQLLLAASGVAAAVSGALVISYFVEIDAVPRQRLLVMGPTLLVCGPLLAWNALWPLLRGITMTPESITYWRGISRIRLAWNELGDAISTNDVRDDRGKGASYYRSGHERYLPGAKIVIPAERATSTRLPVHWENDRTPRLLLETDHFTVEPSALLTAILALRDHPELRPLLGTREAKVLFTGPPWRVRRHMYRTQQWWPKGAEPDGIAVDSDGVVKEFQ